MLCDECRAQPACVHLSKIINNQKTERHLCEECAKKSGEINLTFHIQKVLENNLSVHDFVKALFNQENLNGTEPQIELRCSACGMDYAYFSRTGKLGCAKCYQSFAAELEPLVKKIHGVCTHTGKIPRRAGAALGLWQRIRSLRQELERLVSKEEYEEAARVRDEIRDLEKVLPAAERKETIPAGEGGCLP